MDSETFILDEEASPAQLRDLQNAITLLAAHAAELSAIVRNIRNPRSCHGTAPNSVSVATLLDFGSRQACVETELLASAIEKLRAQRAREKFLPNGMLRDLGWNILLDLFVHDLQGKRVSVSSACLSSGGAATTALRWLVILEEAGLVARTADEHDKRRVYVAVTEDARNRVTRWLEHIA